MRPLLLAVLLAATGAPAAAQEPSEAERAAEAGRPPTPEEAARRDAECDVAAEPSGTVPGVLGPEEVRAISLPGLSVLRLSEIVTGDGADDYSIVQYALLPFGGIGGRDLCGGIRLHHLDVPGGPGQSVSTSGLRLRPGVDVTADYPTTGAEIARRGQVLEVPAGRYAVIEGAVDVVDWRSALGSDGRVDRSRPVLSLGGGVALVPLTR